MASGPSPVYVVTARKGSKRIKGKNEMLGPEGHALWLTAMLHAEECIKETGGETILTTDDKTWHKQAQDAGYYSILRPKHLGYANAATEVVLKHLIVATGMDFSSPIILLQPTTPFRRVSTTVGAVRLWEAEGGLVVATAPVHGALIGKDWDDWESYRTSTESFYESGAFWVASAQAILDCDRLSSIRPITPIQTDPIESFQLDEVEDLEMFQALKAWYQSKDCDTQTP